MGNFPKTCNASVHLLAVREMEIADILAREMRGYVLQRIVWLFVVFSLCSHGLCGSTRRSLRVLAGSACSLVQNRPKEPDGTLSQI